MFLFWSALQPQTPNTPKSNQFHQNSRQKAVTIAPHERHLHSQSNNQHAYIMHHAVHMHTHVPTHTYGRTLVRRPNISCMCVNSKFDACERAAAWSLFSSLNVRHKLCIFLHVQLTFIDIEQQTFASFHQKKHRITFGRITVNWHWNRWRIDRSPPDNWCLSKLEIYR